MPRESSNTAQSLIPTNQKTKKSNKAALDNPLHAPSRSLKVATNLNLKRRGAPGSGCQASTFGRKLSEMKTTIRFVVILAGCLAISVVCWDALVMGKLYYCTDEIGFDFLSPGDWVHGDVAFVSQIDSSVTMSEPDQILAGWSGGRLWVLWSAMLGGSLVISLAGCLIRRSPFSRPAALPKTTSRTSRSTTTA